MTFVVATTKAIVGGAVFLIGTSAPVTGVTLDGTALDPFIVPIEGVDGGSGDHAYSLIVPLSPTVTIGLHQLRVTSGAEFWTQALEVVPQQLPRRAEREGYCARTRGEPDRPQTYFAGVRWQKKVRDDGMVSWVENQDEAVGLVIRSSAGVRLVSGAHYSGGRDTLSGWTIQAVYPDGTVGERWTLDCQAERASLSALLGTSAVPLPGGPGIPLWLDAPGPPAGP